MIFAVVFTCLIFKKWKTWRQEWVDATIGGRIIMSLFGIVFGLSIRLSIIPALIEYSMDLPSFLTQIYKVEVSKVSDGVDYKGRKIMYVNHIRMRGSVDDKDIGIKDDIRVYYLPHTHFIMKYTVLK